jgi:23S rRNA pseudouridine1911/1915/1917 synthase
MIKTNGTQSLLELRPKTGRTHQLRVHMQYIKTPIAGDRVYGAQDSAKRLCLHAHTLELTIPTSERKIFTAPVPKIFEEMV